eukprot:5919456-Pleurochrysis_carterae.AAC.2
MPTLRTERRIPPTSPQQKRDPKARRGRSAERADHCARKSILQLRQPTQVADRSRERKECGRQEGHDQAKGHGPRSQTPDEGLLTLAGSVWAHSTQSYWPKMRCTFALNSSSWDVGFGVTGRHIPVFATTSTDRYLLLRVLHAQLFRM